MAILLQMPIKQRPEDSSFYSAVEACRLTRVPLSTLRYWVEVDIISPSRRLVNAQNQVYRHGYSLADLGYMRLLHHLRSHRVPTENAVRFLTAMLDKIGPPGPAWAEVRVWVDGKHVYLSEPGEWETMEAQTPTRRGAALQRVADTFFGDAFSRSKEAQIPSWSLQNS